MRRVWRGAEAWCRTMGARLALPVGADAAQIVELVIPWKRDRPALGDVRDSARATTSGFEAASSMRLRCDDLVRGAPAETRKRSPCSTAAATAATRQRTSPREDRQPHRIERLPRQETQFRRERLGPSGYRRAIVSGVISSVFAGSWGAPTINHSWSSPVSLTGWRKLSGSTRIASSGPTVSNSRSIRMRPTPREGRRAQRSRRGGGPCWPARARPPQPRAERPGREWPGEIGVLYAHLV